MRLVSPLLKKIVYPCLAEAMGLIHLQPTRRMISAAIFANLLNHSAPGGDDPGFTGEPKESARLSNGDNLLIQSGQALGLPLELRCPTRAL